MSSNEKMLIERLKREDHTAWRNLYANYGPELRRAIERSLKVREISLHYAGDIEQEVWLYVREKISSFEYRGEAKLQHWLNKIAHNRVRTLLQKQKRQPMSLDAISDYESDTTRDEAAEYVMYQRGLYTESAEQTAERRMHPHEMRKVLLPVLERALRELSGRDREIVLLRLIAKEKPHVIAEKYNIKIANVYQIVSRAKKSMKAYLLAQGLFDDGFQGGE